MAGTNARLILPRDHDFRSAVALPVVFDGVKRDEEAWLSIFCDTWFIKKVSTEPMLWGSSNKGAVMAWLALFVDLMETEMVVRSSHPHLACSSDGVVSPRASDNVNELLVGTGNVSVCTERCWVSAAETKTKVAT